MKVTAVRVFYRDNPQATRSWQRKFWQFGVEVRTDAGFCGLGVGGAGIAGVEVVRHALADIVTGRDPLEVEVLWDEMYCATLPFGRRGVAVMAMSSIDLALWDLVGKVKGLPVWRCLNERKPANVRAYATTMHVDACYDLGFRAFKLPMSVGPPDGDAGIDKIEQQAAKARRTIGSDLPLMIDCWMSWNVDYTVRVAKRLAPYRLTWIEEPLLPDDMSGYRALANELKNQPALAAGEHEYGWAGFQDILNEESVTILQPDVTWCGGLTPARRIWRAATDRGKLVAPHRGGEVWGLHLNFAFGGEWAETVCLDGRIVDDPLVIGSPAFGAGVFTPPDKPGFGVRWRDDFLGST